MPDDRQQDVDLSEFWNELVRGEPTTVRDLDPDLAEAVHRLHAMMRAPVPDWARERVRRGVQAPGSSQHNEEESPMTAVSVPWPTHLNGHAVEWTRPTSPGSHPVARSSDAPPRRVSRHRHGWAIRLAWAALLLLTITAGYARFGPDHRTGGPANIPAAVVQVASPSPTGVLNQETLVEITLPADLIAFEATIEVGLAIEVVPAGSTTVVAGVAGGCCTSQSVSYVLEGTSTFRAEAPSYLLRAGGDAPPELVAPGIEVALGPGDAIVYRDASGWAWAVTGDGPMRLLSLWITGAATMPSLELADWVREDTEIVQADPFPADPLTLRLGRATIDTGATLSPGSAVVQVAVAPPDEGARLAVQSDHGIRNAGREPVELYVASLSPAGSDAEVVVAGMQATPAVATPAP